MRKGIFILIVFLLFLKVSIRGQCPDRDSLYKHLNYLRDSSKLSPKEQLAVLSGYLDKMNTCPYKNDSTHAFLLRRIGYLYFLQNDFLKAVPYYHQSIKIMTASAGKPSDLKQLISSYYWLSANYDSLNNVSEKLKALDSCAAIAKRINYVDRAYLSALYARVEYFFDVGDYYSCINYAKRCEAVAWNYANTSTKQEYMTAISYVLSSLAWEVNSLLELNKYESAEKLLVNKVEECKKAGLKNYLGTIYGLLAEVQMQKKNYEKAFLFLNQSLRYYRNAGYDFECKQTLSSIGYNIYYKHFNDADKALVYYRAALKYINKDKSQHLADAFESLNIFANIGNVYIQRGLYDLAHHYFQLAFDQIKPGINETGILNRSPEEFIRQKKIHYVSSLLIDKGDAFRKQYEDNNRQRSTIQQAIHMYRVADQLLERIKGEQIELESKLFWRSDTRRLYEHAIEACYLMGNVEDAFYFFEKSRAVLLNDQLDEGRWRSEKDVQEQTQLKKIILQLERESAGTDKSSVRNTELQNKLLDNKQQLDRLHQVIKAKNPLYYQSFLDSTHITIQDVRQNILQGHQALVEIFAGDSAVYTLIITAKDTRFTRINKKLFDSTANLFILSLSNSDLQNSKFQEFTSNSRQLYRLIFQNNSISPGRIIISPDGRYFPFEALVTSSSDQPLNYFLNDHPVSYTYSARYLLNQFVADSTVVPRNFLGVAPMYYAANKQLISLTASEQSLQHIRSYFSDADNLIASQASKNNFMDKFSKYRIIQLYTHASESSNNGEPVIYFADSALYLSDLINERKPVTRLIVLSACETGLGREYKGEGVFSFNRGFAALGIPTAITNLWSVDDKATYKLTELFYKYLSDGLSIDIALQKAKLEFIASSRENRLPYYWAVAIVTGKADAIIFRKSSRKWFAFAGIIAGLGLLLIWIWQKNRKRSSPTAA
jgi:CHAT domain-containing protein